MVLGGGYGGMYARLLPIVLSIVLVVSGVVVCGRMTCGRTACGCIYIYISMTAYVSPEEVC